LISVIESLLHGAGIEFLVKNESLQGTVPGAGYAVGPVQYWVSREQASDVRELFKQLDHRDPDVPPDE
jgi:hypothetical protein